MIVRKWGRANVQLGSGQLSRPGLDWANQGRAESSHPRSPAFAPKHPTWTNEYPPTGPKHPGDAWKLQGIFLCTYHIFLCVNFILFHAFCEIPEAKFVLHFCTPCIDCGMDLGLTHQKSGQTKATFFLRCACLYVSMLTGIMSNMAGIGLRLFTTPHQSPTRCLAPHRALCCMAKCRL